MKRILIVDDAIELGKLFKDALKTAYPEIPITVVPSGEEALLEATRLSFDLLVTDIRLPGMSGFELIRKIRIRQPHIRVMVITGISLDERLKKQKEELNPEIFLRKPIGISVFLDAVDQMLGFEMAEKSSLLVEQVMPVLSTTPPDQNGQTREALIKEMSAVLPGEPAPGPKKTAPLKKGTGSLAQPAVSAALPEAEGLSGILSRLRSSLGALTTILLDDRGNPVAQTGDLPDLALENQLVPPMMAAISAGAKVSYLLGQTATQSVQAFRGTDFDLVIAPVGQYALLVALKSGRSALRLALAFEEVLYAQSELAIVLEGMGLHIQSVVEVGTPEALLVELGGAEPALEPEMPLEILETPLGRDPSLEKFEALFEKKKTGQLLIQDADSFWDMASSGESSEVSTPGVLTFDQALKLGLLPPEEEKN